jgi:hypothetical protein
MIKKLVFIFMWLFLAAFAVSAQAGLLTVIHGLPALPGAVPSFNPIDIAIDGQCQYIYRLYGAKLGPIEFEAGQHSITFYENAPGQPCAGTQLATTQWNQLSNDEIDVVLGLNSEDQVAISFWDNRTALDLVDGGVEAAVEVRHAAAGPTLAVVLKKGNETVSTGGVPAGSFLGPIETTQGEHTLLIQKGSDVILAQNTGLFQAKRVYWAYVTGSVFKETVKLLTIESIPGEATAGNPPGPPKFSTCCIFGVPSQLSSRNCSQASGLYIGDVNPSPNPCP